VCTTVTPLAVMPNVIATLRFALNPCTVAVVGAASDGARLGGRVMQFRTKQGYDDGIAASARAARRFVQGKSQAGLQRMAKRQAKTYSSSRELAVVRAFTRLP
jgi:hypothetical protein